MRKKQLCNQVSGALLVLSLCSCGADKLGANIERDGVQIGEPETTLIKGYFSRNINGIAVISGLEVVTDQTTKLTGPSACVDNVSSMRSGLYVSALGVLTANQFKASSIEAHYQQHVSLDGVDFINMVLTSNKNKFYFNEETLFFEKQKKIRYVDVKKEPLFLLEKKTYLQGYFDSKDDFHVTLVCSYDNSSVEEYITGYVHSHSPQRNSIKIQDLSIQYIGADFIDFYQNSLSNRSLVKVYIKSKNSNPVFAEKIALIKTPQKVNEKFLYVLKENNVTNYFLYTKTGDFLESEFRKKTIIDGLIADNLNTVNPQSSFFHMVIERNKIELASHGEVVDRDAHYLESRLYHTTNNCLYFDVAPNECFYYDKYTMFEKSNTEGDNVYALVAKKYPYKQNYITHLFLKGQLDNHLIRTNTDFDMGSSVDDDNVYLESVFNESNHSFFIDENTTFYDEKLNQVNRFLFLSIFKNKQEILDWKVDPSGAIISVGPKNAEKSVDILGVYQGFSVDGEGVLFLNYSGDKEKIAESCSNFESSKCIIRLKKDKTSDTVHIINQSMQQ